MNALILTTTLPSVHNRTGADIMLQSYIDALKENGCVVTLVGYHRQNECFVQTSPDIISVGGSYVELKAAKLYPLLWMVKSWLNRLPFTSAKYYSAKYVRTVQFLLQQNNYDWIFLDHSYQLGWLEPIIQDKNKLIVVAHNIEHEVYRDRFQESTNLAARLMYQRETKLVKPIEDRLAQNARETWTLTEYDSHYFSAVAEPSRVRLLGLPPSLKQLPDEVSDKSFDIGMIGSWIWKPNGQGLEWFFQKVYPHLPPHYSIKVAGRGAEWLRDKYPNVLYKGFVPDAKQFMLQAKVIAIPSIAGGGIQIKTLDSIGLGLPIVATPFALRGIANPPSTVKLAEQPEDFANALISLVKSPLQHSASDALQWAKTRREKFIADVGDAICRSPIAS